MDLIQPKPQEFTGQDGQKYSYFLSKVPAIQAREIVTQYPLSALPKLGDYKRNEELMLKLMTYVGVEIGDDKKVQALTTRELVNNHVPDFEVLLRLEAAMIDYNCSFFTKGTGSTFFDLIEAKAKVLISAILTASSEQSSPTVKQPSKN